MDVDNEMYAALKSEFINYYKFIMSSKHIDKIMTNNPNCKGKDDIQFFYVYFLKSMLNVKGGVSKLYNILSKKVKSKKKINNFIYKFLKLDYKCENNMWSWNEIEDYNIEFDWDKPINFTKYEI